MPLGKILYESGDGLDYVYFPTTCIVSKLYITKNGASAEIAVVGNDGIIGISIFMGGGTIPDRAVVRSAGCEHILLIQEFDHSKERRSGGLHCLLLSYTQMLITQMAQLAVCNRHHSVDQQLCRWLLVSLDRLPSKMNPSGTTNTWNPYYRQLAYVR